MSEETNLATRENDQPMEQPERVEPRAVLSPPTDIVETPEALVLHMDLPGCSEEDLNITLENGVLSLRAAPKRFDAEEGFQLSWSDLRDGDFERQFKLSEQIDTERIEATVRHGVLRLTLPKAGNVSRRIPVRAS